MAAALNEIRVHRTSAPDTIDEDLKALWAEVGRDTPVARALMTNLVVFCRREADHQPADDPQELTLIRDVVRRHPSRVIVLHHTGGDVSDGAPISAAVAVVTFGQDPMRYGVEQISMNLSSQE